MCLLLRSKYRRNQFEDSIISTLGWNPRHDADTQSCRTKLESTFAEHWHDWHAWHDLDLVKHTCNLKFIQYLMPIISHILNKHTSKWSKHIIWPRSSNSGFANSFFQVESVRRLRWNLGRNDDKSTSCCHSSGMNDVLKNRHKNSDMLWRSWVNWTTIDYSCYMLLSFCRGWWYSVQSWLVKATG